MRKLRQQRTRGASCNILGETCTNKTHNTRLHQSPLSLLNYADFAKRSMSPSSTSHARGSGRPPPPRALLDLVHPLAHISKQNPVWHIVKIHFRMHQRRRELDLAPFNLNFSCTHGRDPALWASSKDSWASPPHQSSARSWQPLLKSSGVRRQVKTCSPTEEALQGSVAHGMPSRLRSWRRTP